METSFVVSGFGGQGALFAGELLAYAALEAGREVTWIPSYGPEMRGGTAHCTVVIGDEPVGSPLVRQPHHAVVMNLPSLEKYEPLVRAGGVLVVDSALVARPIARDDLRGAPVPATEIARRLGLQRVANTVLLGALVAATGILPLAALEEALERNLPERHRQHLPRNIAALREGAAWVEGVRA